MDCTALFKKAVKAGRELNLLEESKINDILNDVSATAKLRTEEILASNAKDLSKMDPSNPKYDRLKLTADRIKDIASDTCNVASLPSPTGRTLSETTRPNGLKIKKVSVPFGVIGIIYEARPNVTFDVFALCLKSGNACILKGGSDAYESNRTIVKIIQKVLIKHGVDENVITLLPAGHEETAQLLNARGYVDLIIPRGGKSLIDFVRKNASIPVIETGAGICHTYFDEFGDREKGRNIILNAKTRRVSVCNALDCMIIHEKRLADLPYMTAPLADFGVTIYADKKSYAALLGHYPPVNNNTCKAAGYTPNTKNGSLEKATPESFGTEFLSYRMAIKTVSSLDEALEHIYQYSSKHSESIISENESRISFFRKVVDAACVYSNASTAFTDGAQFGLGAEIGISTQKLHARGPMGLQELNTYKYIIEGNGQTRPK
ncbi:MAG: glutamate-5-semialdehyde dehydrogenase [Bacteroidales bacterium]|jgi:glutamate-5-semialdehyde dehydrogenase|nr:glutamate-5-semialdehyde dehydrogenase [Bacteroidales bacterium]